MSVLSLEQALELEAKRTLASTDLSVEALVSVGIELLIQRQARCILMIESGDKRPYLHANDFGVIGFYVFTTEEI